MARKVEVTVVDEMTIEGLGAARPGLKVIHPLFGPGVIRALFAWADGTRTISVDFEQHGEKALVPEYAKLKLL